MGSHDYRLVLLSLFIAILGSYMALDLAGRVIASLNWVRRAWLAGGAVSMGFGIWSMHYVGMLAFRLPVPVLYDVPTVLVSLVAAIFGSAAGLFAVSRRKFGRVEAITGSLAMGTGIVSMHYIGMAAMRLPAMCHYNPLYVGLSILIAVVASLASMVFAFDFRDETRTTWAKVASGAVMGIAIAAMHYTGMAASTFTASDMTETTLYAVSVSRIGIAGVVVVTLILLGFTLLMTVLGRQLDVQSAELQLTETRYRMLFEHFQAGVYRATLDGRILDCNEAFANIFGYSSLNECLTHNVTEHYLSPADWRAFISELREKSTLANLEVQQRGQNGKSVWVLENATLIENKTGVPVIEGSLVDITQRKQSEEDLRQAHEDLRRAHEDLEARVRERTAELAKANEALRAEIAENARAAKEIERLRSQLELERDYLREEVKESQAFGEIIGSSPALRQVLSQIELVAPTEASVLILGESGVGKEAVARAIHERSPRSQQPLVKVNCGSIPRELFESEFFGHVKGAFTGALRDRAGRFELAHRGTLFLDEVSEIPLELQSKLLRVLQEGEFERVGDESTRRVNVRVIAATNRDLQNEVEAGRFRLDLFHRLAVFPLRVPPLRERREDIPILAAHFVQQICSRSNLPRPRLRQRDMEILQQYDWPGNVRELQNVIERAVILARGGALHFDLPVSSRAYVPEQAAQPEAPVQKQQILTEEELRAQEYENLHRALEQTGGRISGPGGAAELLGIHPNTLAYRLKKLGIRDKP